MRRIVLASQKGGTGKTSSAACLAVGLARRGLRTLAIDCDAQANLTWTLAGGAEVEGPTLADVLMRHASADEAIRATTTPNLDLMPGDASLSGVNVALVQELGRDSRLRSAMASLADRWDFVVLDTAPTVTTILANALVYASEVITPIDCGMYGMLGLVQLQQTIEEVREAYGNHALHLSGLLLTKVSRNNVCRDIEAGLRERFGELVFKATIPLSSKIDEAHTRAQTVMTHAPKSAGAIAYEEIVTEVLEHGSGKKERGGIAGGRRPGADDAAA